MTTKHAFIYERSIKKNQDRKLDVATVARRLSVSTTSVYRMIDSGELPAIKSGPKKGYRIRESDVKRREEVEIN